MQFYTTPPVRRTRGIGGLFFFDVRFAVGFCVRGLRFVGAFRREIHRAAVLGHYEIVAAVGDLDALGGWRNHFARTAFVESLQKVT